MESSGFGRGLERGRDRRGYGKDYGRGYSSGRGRDGIGRGYSGRDRAMLREDQADGTSSVGSVITVERIISTVANSNSHSEPGANAGTMAVNERDTNAGTCCLGKHFVILEFMHISKIFHLLLMYQ